MDMNRGTVPAPAENNATGDGAEFRDKNFLFSDGRGGGKDVWIVRGFQVPKLTLYQVLTGILAAFSILLIILLIAVSSGGGSGGGRPRAQALQNAIECEKPHCLQQAAQMVGYMNYSANPCEDFYEYACGNFDVMHPRGIHISYGVSNMLEDYNRGRLEELLEQPQFHDDDSAVSKARTFYTTCVNAYDQSENYAQSMVDLINQYGGMELFGTWNPDGWTFRNTFRETREIHRIRLFFVVIWFQKLDKIIIRLPKLGLRSRSAYNRNSPLYNSTMENYRNSITSILNTLERDVMALENNNITQRSCNNSCINEIVDDIIDIETQISQKAPGIIDILPGPRNSVNLTELGRLTDEIDWRELMDSLFGKGAVTDSVTIHIPSRTYMTEINQMIRTTPKKKMHHYIMWALIKQYVMALGPKYSILDQEMENSVDGKEGKPREELCYNLLRTYMGRAVRAMFIFGHIGDQKVDKVIQMVEEARKVLNNSFDWMTPSAKRTSQEVLKNLTILYGHSPWIKDRERLDNYYDAMSLDSTDFFHNLKAAYEFQSLEYKAKGTLADEDSEAENGYWIKSEPSDVKVTFSPLLLAMNVPYGALQVPWYNNENPSYINSAALGSILYGALAQPFILQHRTFRTPDWWDRETRNRYTQYKECIQDSFSQYETRIPRGFQMSQGRQKLMFMRPVVKLDPLPSLDYLQAEHYAFNLAYQLHKELERKQTGQTLLLPGLQHTTPDQSFFLAYAQSRCQNNQPYLEVLLNAAFHKFPHPKMINNFVFNNDKFREAYKCKTVPPEHSRRQCSLD